MHLDPDVLKATFPSLMARLPGSDRLTPAERTEVLHVAQGLACKESAVVVRISPETIRARRKRIYRKLEMSGANELLARLLCVSVELLARAEGAASARSPLGNGSPPQPSPTW